MPFASSPTFGFLYRNTVAHFPQAFLLLIASIKLVEGAIVTVVNYGMRKEEREMELHNKLKKEEEERKPLKEIEMKEIEGKDIKE